MKNIVLWLLPLILAGLASGLKDPICGQEPGVVGVCRAAIPMFTYDASSNTCQFFRYGGCEGNENRFKEREICEDKCLEKV